MKPGYCVFNPTTNFKKNLTFKELSELTKLSASDLDIVMQSKTRLPNLGFILPSNTPEEVFDELFLEEHPNEIWTNVKRIGGSYEVSNYGRVRKIKPNGDKGPVLKNHTRGGNKSFSVQLTLSGKKKWELVHRLVAEHFLENFDPEKYVFHIDGDYTNNYYLNLNCTDRSELGRKCSIRARDKKTKIVCIDAETGKTIGIYSSTREVERELGIGRQSVSDNLNGKTVLSHNKYIFEYELKKETEK